MNITEAREIATRWVTEKGKFSEPWERLEEAMRYDPKMAFRIIEEIHYILTSEKEINYQLMGLLAAGHLENLLCDQGQEIINEVEFLASNDDEFRKLLCGVWKSEIDDAIYTRVKRCMHPSHEFD